jgi:hypothetical protein
MFFSLVDVIIGGRHYTIPEESVSDEEVVFGSVKVKRAFIFMESLNSCAFVNRKCIVPGRKFCV